MSTIITTPNAFKQNLTDKLNARPRTATTTFVDKFPQIQSEHRLMFDALCSLEVIKSAMYSEQGGDSKDYEIQVSYMQGAKQMAHKLGYPFEFLQYFLDRYGKERRNSVLSVMDFERYQSKGVVEFENYESYLLGRNISQDAITQL